MTGQKKAALIGFIICFLIVIVAGAIKGGGIDGYNIFFGVLIGLVGGMVAAFFAK